MTIVLHATQRRNPVFACRPPIIGACLSAVLVAAAIAPAIAQDETDPGSLVPHRTVFTFSLAEAESSSGLEGVSGGMTGEWTHDCEGWMIGQTVDMTLFDRMGGEIDIVSSYATWEAFDGSEMSFTLSQESDIEGARMMRGSAARMADADETRVDYRLPEQGRESLSADVVFPVAHTVELIDRAQAGEAFYAARVFDGTELDWREHGGDFDISASISPSRTASDAEHGDDIDDSLLQGESWRMSMAHFSSDADAMEPRLEVSMRLFANGVADQLQLDYGDFVIDAQLTELERLDPPSCGG